jgi:DNA adenine methylase
MDNNDDNVVHDFQVVPVIKYAGGKRRIMGKLMANFPNADEFNNYHEPFLGGGSVFMELYNSGLLRNKEVYLSDTMDSLMNMYSIIKTHPRDLITELKREDVYKNDKDHYIENRKRFNELKHKAPSVITHAQKVEYAALFMYLNKVCFNGMYRENKSGNYNVPFGDQKTPNIPNEDNIMSLWKCLNAGQNGHTKVNIECCDYRRTLENVEPGDFIYIDPPYYKTFTGYNKESFDANEQRDLAEFYRTLTQRGCKVALSNSDHEFIRDLYSDIPNVKFVAIYVRRMINCDVEGRKEVKRELLIVNY